MEPFKQEWEDFRAQRFRTAKKWLRYFPSRATLRKSFIFRKFGGAVLNKIPQLWSFAYKPMCSAYYAGWIITWWPIMGIQIPVATLFAILFRGNVPLAVALQLVSNPFTVPFMYPLEFYAGKRLVRIRAAAIVYVIAQDKYIVIRTTDGQDHRYRTTFRTICRELDGNHSFLECNRGILLNMNSIRRTDGEMFEMDNGSKFPIRRSDRRRINNFRTYQFEQLNNINVFE